MDKSEARVGVECAPWDGPPCILITVHNYHASQLSLSIITHHNYHFQSSRITIITDSHHGITKHTIILWNQITNRGIGRSYCLIDYKHHIREACPCSILLPIFKTHPKPLVPPPKTAFRKSLLTQYLDLDLQVLKKYTLL